jgi:hypothetical protein
MTEPKSFASLSPTLLARKGGAKPAMRHQMQHSQEATARQLEDPGQLDDLGFNDHGEDQGEPVHEAEIVQLNPGGTAVSGDLPEVMRQRGQAAIRVAGSAKRRRSALADGRSAAFTLRLDADRHLKLRLACTLEGRSAQQLVTDALDCMLSQLPEVGAMAAQAGKHRRNS